MQAFLTMPLMPMAARCRHRTRGFTLIEMMVVILIVAILAAIGIPMLTEFIADQRARTVASDIAAEFAFARAKAIESSRRVYIEKTGALWSNGWRIFVDLDNDGAFDAAEILKVFNGFPAGTMYVCALPVGGDFSTNIILRPDGRVVRTVGAQPTDGLYVVNTLGDADDANNKVRALLFGLSGRVSVVRQNGTLPCVPQ